MAAFTSPSPATAPFGRVARIFTRLLGDFLAWNDARRTRAELLKLSEHELSDIGLSRGDVERISNAMRRY